jgi:translation initiation factor IF-2
VVVDSEERARMLSQGRKKKQEKDRLRKIDEGMADELEIKEETPERVEMPIIVKADVQGSVQAVTDALRSLNSAQVFLCSINSQVPIVNLLVYVSVYITLFLLSLYVNT